MCRERDSDLLLRRARTGQTNTLSYTNPPARLRRIYSLSTCARSTFVGLSRVKALGGIMILDQLYHSRVQKLREKHMRYRLDSYLIWACYGDSCDIPPDIPSNIAVVGGRREVWEKV